MEVEEPNTLTLEARIQALIDYGVTKPLTIYNNVSKFHDVCEKTVYNKINKINEGESLLRKEYHRDSPIFNDEIKKQIMQYFQKNEYIYDLKQLKNDLNISSSTSRLKQVLNELGITFFKADKKPLLTQLQVDNRLIFSKKQQKYNWNYCLFADEVSFWTHQYQEKVWCFQDNTIQQQVPKYPQKVHVFAGISKQGRTALYMFYENLTGDLYKEIIEAVLVPDCKEIFKRRKWFYVHDNDPKHKSKIATNSFQENKINLLSDFPSASPDLNPIENIWAYIKHILAKKSLTNLKDLEEEIIKIWDNLDQEIIDNCIDSMSTRLQKCIELQGRMTEYL